MVTATRSWRRVVLPDEHGVWGLLAAAALVGLPLGGGPGGLGLVAAALAVVIARQAWTQRAAAPGRATVVVGLAALTVGGGMLATLRWAADPAWFAWAGPGAALGAAHALFAGRLTGRPWWLSALAGMAFAALAGAIASAGGAPPAWTLVGAGALAAHLTAIVPLVRAQVRGSRRWAGLAIECHLIAALVATAGWSAGAVPGLVAAMFDLGLARCLWLVHTSIAMNDPARIGMREMAWLPVLAAGVVAGLRLGGA